MRHAFDLVPPTPVSPRRRPSKQSWRVEKLVIVLIACGVLWIAVLLVLPTRAPRGCHSWTVATASRLRMIGMAAEGYAIDNGQYPSSAEALREYWPELPGEVVFTFKEAIPSMLRLSADPAETPYVWLAQVRQEDAANHLVALKRVDRGEARGTIVLLFGDMSVRYVKAEDLIAELDRYRRQASAAAASPE